MRIGVGLIGYGAAGSAFHAPLIRAVERLDLRAIVTSRVEQASNLGVRVLASTDELLDDPSIDLVVVATPNESHFPLAAAALRAGKHVVVDKPLALNTEEADALIALADETGRVLSVFHNRRWDSDYLTVKAVRERLGPISLYEAHWDRFRPGIKRGWRELPGEGAGLLNDLGPHLIDQALQLFGPPHAVTGDLAVQRAEAQVDDYFHVTLHYGAMRAILSASTLTAAARPHFALHGSEGSFVKYGLDPQEAALKAGLLPTAAGFGEEPPELSGTLTCADGSSESVTTRTGRYVDYYEGIADAVAGQGPVPVAAADARLGLRIIGLARQSAREGRRLPLG